MGGLGYTSDAQSNLARLVQLARAIRAFAARRNDATLSAVRADRCEGDGEYRQLSTRLLQIENEFYGTIRPKRSIAKNERPIAALTRKGRRDVEVRCIDLDPFLPVGIDAEEIRFIDTFLLHCLLSDSPPETQQEIAALGRNQQRVAARGREPGLRLERGAEEVTLVDWAGEFIAECEPVAAALDAAARHDRAS